jgi:serine/threonine protein kinase/Tfp pilus assembly protein PilF
MSMLQLRSSWMLEDTGTAGAGNDPGLVSEFHEAWQRDRRLTVEAFLLQHSDPCPADALKLDLIYEEYCLRTEAGQNASPEEYVRRFPEFADEIANLFYVSGAIDAKLLGRTPLEDRVPKIGATFLDYRIERLLGKGGMSFVFLASDTALGERKVALKFSDSGRREAQTLGRLEHSHIVPVHSVSEDPARGLTAVCMPYLGNATLADVVERISGHEKLPRRAAFLLDVARQKADPRDGALPDEKQADPFLRKAPYVQGIVHLGAQLADALAYAHELGIYHRDLKPSNVLLTVDGKACLLDFNLSFDIHAAGQVLGGTIPYMAPEQIRAVLTKNDADLGCIDDRADIFALGVILYELFSGKNPFGVVPSYGRAAEALAPRTAQLQRGAMPLRQVCPGVGRKLAALIDACLALEPKQRPQSIALVAKHLKEELARYRSRPKRYLTAAAALVLLSAGVGVAYGAMRHASLPERERLAGLAALDANDLGAALDHLNRAVQVEPARNDLRLARARVHVKREEFDQALADYEQAGAASPDPRAKAAMAYCKQARGRMGDYDQAMRLYQEAIDEGYRTAAVLNNLGRLFLAAKKVAEAESCLDEALRLDPQLQSAYQMRALVRMERALNARDELERTRLFWKASADCAAAAELAPLAPQLARFESMLAKARSKHELTMAALAVSTSLSGDLPIPAAYSLTQVKVIAQDKPSARVATGSTALVIDIAVP